MKQLSGCQQTLLGVMKTFYIININSTILFLNTPPNPVKRVLNKISKAALKVVTQNCTYSHNQRKQNIHICNVRSATFGFQ